MKLSKDRWHDGAIDLNRRGKRFSAFLTLFNRNFLYRIERMVSIAIFLCEETSLALTIPKNTIRNGNIISSQPISNHLVRLLTFNTATGPLLPVLILG